MDILNRLTHQLELFFSPKALTVLSLIGLVVVVSKSIQALRSLWKSFFHFGSNLPERYGPGSYALITGGANGIGAAFADELAAKGFNLVLMDVDESNLTLTATGLNKKYPTVLIKTISCDFSKVWQEGYLNFLDKDLQGLDVSILVNNVGRGCGSCPLHETIEKNVIDTVAVNLLTMTLMTRKFTPIMLKRTNKSAIVNISSISGLYPWPNLISVYVSSKAYVDILSRSVSEEVGDKIDVLTVRPSGVSTALLNNPKLNSFIITPASVAGSVLNKLGRVTVTAGHWRHEINSWFTHSAFLRKLACKAILRTVAADKAKAEAEAAAAAVIGKKTT